MKLAERMRFELKRLFIKCYCISIAISLASCALVVTPTGGPKDLKPPVVVQYQPDSAATNFDGHKIKISFDEFIQLKDLQGQLVISPPLVHNPDIKAHLKTLNITFKDTLKPNTTYAFNFGTAVADLNEGNSLDGFKYVFSTGPYLDSLVLTGQVKDANTQAPQKAILVMLYDQNQDSLPFKQLPSYFGKTKENGTFKITNIKPGKYKVVALKDVNSNYKYDSPDESIGYLDTLINLHRNTSIGLNLFKETPRKQYLKRSWTPEYGHLQVIFNRKAIEPQFVILENHTNLSPPSISMVSWTSHRDTADIWMPSYASDSIHMVVYESRKVLDTIHLEMPAKTSKQRKFKFSLLNSNGSPSFDPNQTFQLQFNHPVKAVNPQLITANYPIPKTKTLDSTLKLPFTPINFPSKPNQTGLKINWEPDSSYVLTFLKGAVTDIYDNKSDSTQIKLRVRPLNYYGTLMLSVKLPQNSPSIIQLVDEKENVWRSQKINTDTLINFDYLSPNTYRIKYIKDENNDGEWTTGDYLQHRQPEPVIYFSTPIIVRSNWDLEQEWKVKP